MWQIIHRCSKNVFQFQTSILHHILRATITYKHDLQTSRIHMPVKQVPVSTSLELLWGFCHLGWSQNNRPREVHVQMSSTLCFICVPRLCCPEAIPIKRFVHQNVLKIAEFPFSGLCFQHPFRESRHMLILVVLYIVRMNNLGIWNQLHFSMLQKQT